VGSNRFKLLIAVVSVLTILSIVGYYVYPVFFRDNRIHVSAPVPQDLPSQVQGNLPDPLVSFQPYEPLGLDPENAKWILGTLNRPDSYRCTIQNTWYWESGQAIQICSLAVFENSFTLEISGAPEDTSEYWYGTADKIVRWAPDHIVPYEGPTNDISLDDLCCIPTYEELKEKTGDIINIGYEKDNGRYLIVYTKEEPYLGQYLLNIDSGLLEQAVFYDMNDPEVLVYRTDLLTIDLSEPDPSLFVVPGEYS
jgi:hypothetical protein